MCDPRSISYNGRMAEIGTKSKTISEQLRQEIRIFKPVAEMAFMRGMLHDFPRVVNTAPESPNFWYNLAMSKAIEDVATIISDK